MADLKYDVQFEQSGLRGRFYIELGGGHEAEMTFLDRDGTFVVHHTGVPKEFEGKGIALELVKAGVEYAREYNKKIEPVCPYVVMQFKRHPDWADIAA